MNSNIFEEHNEKRCNKWDTITKRLELCDVSIMKNNNDVFLVNGELRGELLFLSNVEKLFIKFWAANPPTYSQSFSGSALPYPSEEVAFHNSSNVGVVPVKNGKFSFSITFPNSYYDNMGSVYVPPQIKIKACNNANIAVSKIQQINLSEGVPFRTLTWTPKKNPDIGCMFYCNPGLKARTQEEILKASAYPVVNKVPNNFWGERPAP